MSLNFIKKVVDYCYLRLKGVDTKFGYCRLVGYPRIVVVKGARIKIDAKVTIVSKTNGNVAGVYGRTILAAISEGAILTIGYGSGLSGTRIVCVKSVTIGRHVGMGVNTTIYDTDFHPVEADKRLNQRSIMDAKYSPVYIGDQVMVGANAIILKGVEIPERCVIGAGSILARSPEYVNSVYAGNPAVFIRRIESD
ncbi:acyltransferase [Thalassolituus sp. LLYu03]|uniref:acyltransferase n=1 Tax=Thalassolituus sp. LLYu03 TaxID=3421656 RepID=UPI003D2AE375